MSSLLLPSSPPLSPSLDSQRDILTTDLTDRCLDPILLTPYSVYEIRCPPLSTLPFSGLRPDPRRLEIGCGEDEQVYEAACWVRAWVGEGRMGKEGGRIEETEFFIMAPSEVEFETFPQELANEEDECVGLMQDVRVSMYLVTWHLHVPQGPIRNLTSRDVRTCKTTDSKFVSYIKDQPVEIFLSASNQNDFIADSRILKSEKWFEQTKQVGIWVLGYVLEDTPSDSTTIRVHVFGNWNKHAVYTSVGPRVVQSFGYDIVFDRSACMIRAIRFVGAAPGGREYRFGNDDLLDNALETNGFDQASSSVDLYARIFSALALLLILVGLIFCIYYTYPAFSKVYGGLFLGSLGALSIITAIGMLLVVLGISPAEEAVRFLTVSTSSKSSLRISAISNQFLLFWLPSLMILSIIAWAFVVSPFWLVSYLVEGIGRLPWWVSLLVDIGVLFILLFSIMFVNDTLIRRDIEHANLLDQNPLADFIAARKLEELRATNTPLIALS